jgi:small ubiquitin-related modifier
MSNVFIHVAGSPTDSLRNLIYASVHIPLWYAGSCIHCHLVALIVNSIMMACICVFKYPLSSQGIAMATMRFRFDGQPINESDTPISLEMEEGDTIEVYQQQTGGRRPHVTC